MKTEIKRFAEFIESKTGISYTESSAFQLERRLNELSSRMLVPDLNALWLSMNTDRSDRIAAQVIDLATNNETLFFRDPSAFRAFSASIIPELSKLATGDLPLRVWSAAASTGQEMLSVLIALEESQIFSDKVEMLVSDISHRVLDRCRAGRYSDLEVERGLSSTILQNYFTRSEEMFPDFPWSVRTHLLAKCRFEKINLVNPEIPNPGTFELILCRNILIYQRKEQKEKTVAFLARNLINGGFLWVGASESLAGITDDFEQFDVSGFSFYRKKNRI